MFNTTKKTTEYGRTLASVFQTLSNHFTRYRPIFCNRTKIFFDKAEHYTQGIVQSRLRNIERIREDLDAQYHQMQHFITESCMG